ncbi:MAG: hypothetical protein AAFV29_10470, partial [Myxococcota bacterium]
MAEASQPPPPDDVSPGGPRPGGPRAAPAKRAEAPSRLRDPQGEILFGLVGGYTSVNGSSFGTAGVHLGYAALT